MADQPNAITFKGNPMTLTGSALKVGDTAPDFSLVATDMAAKSLADYAGKPLMLVTVPSIDTPVCDVESRRFNEEAAGKNANVVIVSIDTPFAQKRWCGAAGIKNVHMLSDYKTHEFGKAWGVRVKELGILARCIFVVKDGKITYKQLTGEIAQEPDYAAALAAL